MGCHSSLSPANLTNNTISSYLPLHSLGIHNQRSFMYIPRVQGTCEVKAGLSALHKHTHTHTHFSLSKSPLLLPITHKYFYFTRSSSTHFILGFKVFSTRYYHSCIVHLFPSTITIFIYFFITVQHLLTTHPFYFFICFSIYHNHMPISSQTIFIYFFMTTLHHNTHPLYTFQYFNFFLLSHQFFNL